MQNQDQKVTIAVDAMGGDNAPDSIIEGVALCVEKHPDVKFALFGQEEKIKPLVEKHGLFGVCDIHHTPDVIKSGEKPSIAVRSGMNSSMFKAVGMVRAKNADAVVSSGNTGALMAISKISLRTLPGILRPAIAGLLPSPKGKTVMLDLGANSECDSEHLVQFAMMGVVYARIVSGVENPSVALLNIGSEDIKGRDEIKQAAQVLKDSPLKDNFKGFIEGYDLLSGDIDVVVADGFTGNVALKTMEGSAKFVFDNIKKTAKSSWFYKLCILAAAPLLLKLKKRFDSRNYNGAIFIGLDGISVKSHGGSDAKGFANALEIAINLAKDDISTKIKDEIDLYDFI